MSGRLHHLIAGHGDQPGLHFDDRTWTFAELERWALRMARDLVDRTEPGDRVAVLGHNRPDVVAVMYAASMAGVVLVPLNPRLHPEEWIDQLERSGAVLILGAGDLLETLPTTIPTLAWDEWQLAPGGAADRSGPETAWIIFTSGTTGTPKGAVLTHGSVRAAITTTSAGRPVANDDVYVFPFPLCHVAAYNVLLHHRAGRPVVLLERFDPGAVLDAVARHHATSMSLAPTMLAALLDHPATSRADLTSLRNVGYGASPITPDLLERAMESLGCDFAQGYGMTELSGNAVFLDAEHHRRAVGGEPDLLAAAGRPGPGVELAILGGAHTGEIVVRAPQVFAGYWDDEAATRAAFTPEGFFRTGDVGRIDESGLLYLVDRVKDMIVTGGENVASLEVERVIAAMPGVGQVAVVGLPDQRWGEAVCAVVVRAGSATITEADVVDHCREHLASFKKPRHVLFVDDLPKNASGKILKRELRDLAGRSAGEVAEGL